MTKAEDTAAISIDGGPTFEEGAMVTIRCYLTGFSLAFGETRYFKINGILYNSSTLETNLMEYTHMFSRGFTTSFMAEANYTLTLQNASASYNGTTFQCIGRDEVDMKDHPSEVVTLIIIGK